MSADRHGGSAAALKRFGEKTRNGRLERRRRSSIAVHDVLIDPELGGFAIRCKCPKRQSLALDRAGI
jgi:hypothetical protein